MIRFAIGITVLVILANPAWAFDESRDLWGSNGFAYRDSSAVGACCLLDDVCEVIDADSCSVVDGEYQGNETTCDPNPCLLPGACCIYDGSCETIDADSCFVIGGEFQGELTACDPNPCPLLGACCFADGGCSVGWIEDDCFALYPEVTCTWIPSVNECDPIPCPQDRCPVGCCLPDRTCERVTDDWQCAELFAGVIVGFICNFEICPPTGACCLGGGICIVQYEERCLEIAGARWIPTLTCDPNPCSPAEAQDPSAQPSYETISWGKIKTGFK